MNLSTFIHSEKDRHGMRSMKIEPVGEIINHPLALGTMFIGGNALVAGDKLYTEAQMIQLGEACAALVETQHSTKDEQTYGLIAGGLIRNLIKEMLG